MLAIQIDNPDLEKTLSSQFKTAEEMKNYLSKLIIEDLVYRHSKIRAGRYISDNKWGKRRKESKRLFK